MGAGQTGGNVGELAALAHELRTPLTVINGYAHLLKSDELSPEQRARACEQILEKCDELNSLIRGYLEQRESELRLSLTIKQTA
jgi:signal transduction histidine kinase